MQNTTADEHIFTVRNKLNTAAINLQISKDDYHWTVR